MPRAKYQSTSKHVKSQGHDPKPPTKSSPSYRVNMLVYPRQLLYEISFLSKKAQKIIIKKVNLDKLV
jgi:hypothetical protein